NPEMMDLIRDNTGSTAWVVGQFDEIRRRMRLPSGVAQQVPPIRLVSVKAHINGGVKATIRAEAGDKAAADQLRDVVRGFISLARLQGGAKPEIDSMLKPFEQSRPGRAAAATQARPIPQNLNPQNLKPRSKLESPESESSRALSDPP